MKRAALWLFVLCAVGDLAVAATGQPVTRQLRFDVLLDDSRIGSHSFEIAADRDGKRVRSEARFDVRVLLLPVYSYRHASNELWRDGCLAAIDSETDANGTPYAVAGRREGDLYRIDTGARVVRSERACLMTFAYWDKRFLRQRELLNSQTGEIVPVDIEPLGRSQQVVAGQSRAVDGYRIVAPAEGVDIRVFYAADGGDWVALESTLEKGRVMRYVRAAPERVAEAAAWQD